MIAIFIQVAYGNTKKNADGTFTCQHGMIMISFNIW